MAGNTVRMRGTQEVGCTGWEIPFPVITAEVTEVSKWNGKENTFNLIPNACIPHMPTLRLVQTDTAGKFVSFFPLPIGSKECSLLLLLFHYLCTIYSFQKLVFKCHFK